MRGAAAQWAASAAEDEDEDQVQLLQPPQLPLGGRVVGAAEVLRRERQEVGALSGAAARSGAGRRAWGDDQRALLGRR